MSPTTHAAAEPVADPSPTADRIVDAAEECLRRFGLQRASMAAIAAQAGVSRGTVYLHFAHRQALVDAVLERAAARFVESAAVEVARQPSLAAQAGAAAVFIRQHLGDHVLGLRLPADEENLVAVMLTAQRPELLAGWVEFWQPFLADAAARGEIRAGLDHRRAAEWILRVMLSFAVMGSVTFDADEPAALRRFIAEHLVDGLGPGTPNHREGGPL